MIKSWIVILLIFMMQQNDRQKEREWMVKSQIVARGVTHEATLAAMRKVPRHRFVPPSQQMYAYEDEPLPIGQGQTISQPYIVAYMTEAIEPAKGMKVLEIGTGSGYQAAVLAEIVDEVYTIEIIKELGEQARQILTAMGYKNIHFKIGDGYMGWPAYAPFDAIVVTAAAPEVPPPLVNQLKEGGKMIIPVGNSFSQELILVEKHQGKVIRQSLLPVRFVPFTREKNKEK